MKNYSVRMIRENMENIPQFPVPEGFAIRNYRRNEGHIWTRIQKAAEPYMNIDDGLFRPRVQTRFLGHWKTGVFISPRTPARRLGQSRHGGKMTDGDRFTGSQSIPTIKDVDFLNR